MMEEYIPSKMTSTKFSPPWISDKIKRLSNKKQRPYNKWKKSHNPKDKATFDSFKRETQKIIRKAHWDYVNQILVDSFEKHDSKPFWRYVKAKGQENVGIAPLKKDGILHNKAQDKAEILNNQFYSVFTKDQDEDIPQLGTN